MRHGCAVNAVEAEKDMGRGERYYIRLRHLRRSPGGTIGDACLDIAGRGPGFAIGTAPCRRNAAIMLFSIRETERKKEDRYDHGQDHPAVF